jgi:hypothetical protein
MSFAWAFYTVSRSKFEGCFSGPHPEKQERIISALTWDGGVDLDAAEFAANHIANHGLDYSGLSIEDATLLDECFAMLISPEGLGEELECVSQSPDFVHPSVVESLHRAADASKITVRLLPILRSGRRYGAAEPTPNCNYCFFSPSEAKDLARELSAILSAINNWGKEKWMPDLVTECLLQPLTKCVESDRPLIGRLG